MELNFERCECCEWITKVNDLPICLLEDKQVGILTCCDKFKPRTGEHITF